MFGVDDIAVIGDGDSIVACAKYERLDIHPAAGTGG